MYRAMLFLMCALLSLSSFKYVQAELTVDKQPQSVLINFSGISSEEYARFREYLLAYSGFTEIDLLQKSASRVSINYQTHASLALLENNLKQTSSSLGLQVFLDSNASTINLQVIGRETRKSLRFGEW
jgi:hypothetical protein